MAAERKNKEAAKSKTAIDHDLIRDLARLLEETGLTEIEYEREGHRVRVAREARHSAEAASAPAVTPAASITTAVTAGGDVPASGTASVTGRRRPPPAER